MNTRYTLIRSIRKTLAIHITKEANVEVRAPLKMLQKDIDAFVQKKILWIDRHVAEQQQRLERKNEFSLQFGEILQLHGNEYPLLQDSKKKTRFDGKAFWAPAELSGEQLKQAIVKLYRTLAREMICMKVNVYAKQMNLPVDSVRITSAKTRWGSCSSKNRLSFSWRLVFSEESVVDYLVVHELAHIKEHNHSSAFWNIVKFYLPEYQDQKKKLKQLQEKLSKENWD